MTSDDEGDSFEPDDEAMQLEDALKILDSLSPEEFRALAIERGLIEKAADTLVELARGTDDDPSVSVEAQRIIDETGLGLLQTADDDTPLTTEELDRPE